MRLRAYLQSLAAKFLRRAQTEDDLDEELRAHVDLRTEDLVRSGLSRAEAERRARIEFGGRERFKEECREALGGSFVETLTQDARFAVRVLRKSPGFTCVAIGTLALAIGANAVVFGMLDGLVLHPIKLARAESLYGIENPKGQGMNQSYPDYLDLRDRNRSFEGLAGYTYDQVGFDTGGQATRSWAEVVSGNYFDVLGVQPYAGRLLHASDEHGPGSAPYIVLSHGFWHSRFQDDPGVIGRVVRLNQHPFTIVGVAPPEFHGVLLFSAVDFFVPFVNHGQLDGESAMEKRGVRSLFMTLGHLKPGVTPNQAAADLNSIGSYLEKTYPKQHGATTFTLARPGLYGNYLGPPVRAFVAALMLLAGLVLLAACANLGSLFAARAADRGREVALRLALGATRARILRQLLTEAVLIALAGGALGLWGSVALLRTLSVWRPLPRFPIQVPVSPDPSVYLVALALALVSGLLFGIVPVRQVFRANAYQVIKAGASGGVGRRISARDFLLAAQIALCAVLVTSSMVALRGLSRSHRTNFGFNPNDAILLDTDLMLAGYSAERAPAVQKRMLETVEQLPGVRSAGFVNTTPLSADSPGVYIFGDSAVDLRPSNAVFEARRFKASPGYFDAASTVLLAGRSFTWHDGQGAPRVTVVNREFARRLFGSVSGAIGGYCKTSDGARVQVVGVTEDGKYGHLTEDPLPAFYLSILQAPSSQISLIVRSSRDPERLAADMRNAIRAVDPALPTEIQTWNRALDLPLFPARVATVALSVLGGMGAILAMTGIFAMAAYSVGKRLKELGIRLALGAQRRDVLHAALDRALKLLLLGSAAGVLLGILSAKVLASIVFQASPRDPIVLGGAVLSMLLLGLLATWIPARRALSADPLRLLREE
jgi:predicted permease